jgi:hypothetical protein
MREWYLAHTPTDGKHVVFVESSNNDKCSYIGYDEESDKPIRFTGQLSSLSIVKSHLDDIRLDHFDLWFKVKANTITVQSLGETSGINGIVNSVLQLRAISNNTFPNHLGYILRSGHKTFLFHPDDIMYLPMLSDGTRKINDFTIGAEVRAVIDYPCHGLVKNDTYIVQDIVKDKKLIFNGTIYAINTKTKEYVTTYSKFLKLNV